MIHKRFIFMLSFMFLSSIWCATSYAEQCTQGVHEILSWTHKITGNACQWPKNAKKLGFKVNHTPKDNTVLVFPPDYGHGIDREYGHVAVLLEIDKKKGFLIQDSNGIAGGDKGTKWLKQIDFTKVEVIHQK
jgi:surface antigen